MGATTIILAFDDYEFVPKAKAITQRKRREKLEPLQICGWPSAPPQPWINAMANAEFKATVVEWIIKHLPAQLQLTLTEVILDWKGSHYSHITYIGPSDWWVETVAKTVGLGEADVKFLWWARELGRPMAVISIDGDYVPIAMSLECEICILRRGWIYVNMLKRMLQLSHRELVMMIALTGTDFSRKLPFIKPRHMYLNMRPWKKMILGAVDDDQKGVALVRQIYGAKFKSPTMAASKMPPMPQILCTLRNARFVWQYWTEPETPVPDLKPFGFKIVDNLVQYDDDTI